MNSEQLNTKQPSDWAKAIKAAAADAGMSVSEFVAVKCVPAKVRKTLSKRRPAHRPRKTQPKP